MPEDWSKYETKQAAPEEQEDWSKYEVPVKKKESSVKNEPSGSDLETPSPLLKKNGEAKSFTEKIATNDLPRIPEFKTKGESVLEQRKQTPMGRIKEVNSSDYPELDKFYKENPHVAGMNHSKGEVSKNPYSKLPQKNIDAVISLEKTRDIMSNDPDAPKPSFKITDEQKKYFESIKDKNPNTIDYHDIDDDTKRQTIASRLYVGDEMNGVPFTKEQEEYVNKLHKYATSPQEKLPSGILEATKNLPQTFAKQQTKGKSDAEILAEKKSDSGFLKSTTDLIGGINRAITNAPAEIAKSGAELINYGGNKINNIFGIQETKIEDNPVYKLADSYTNWMDNNVYEDVDKESLPNQIGSGLGQAATMIATGGGSAVSKGVVNASKVAKTIKSSVVPFSQVFNSEYEGMKDAGESEDVAFEQAIVNAAATTPLEKLPIANLFTRYKKYIGSDLSKRALTASAQALEEGSTEGLQQVFSNLTNNQLVELDANTKEWNKDVGNSTEVGGYVGLILGTISSVAQGRLKGKRDGGVQVQEPTQQSATNTEGAQSGNDTPQQQEPIIHPTNTEANQGVVQIAKVEERNVPEITQMSGNDVEALVQERLSPPKEDLTTQQNTNRQEDNGMAVEGADNTGYSDSSRPNGISSDNKSEEVSKTDVETGDTKIIEQAEQNKITNEPNQEQNVPTGILDQSGTKDSETKKGTEQVKESKFNIRQRLGVAVNDALARLADKDRLMYKVLQNSVLLEEADAEIAKDIDAAFESVIAGDNKVSELSSVFAKAGRLINIFEDAIKNTDDQQAKEFLTEKLDQIRISTQKKATLGGQAVQALSTVGNILPERDMVVLGVIAQREATINKEGLKTIESEAVKDANKAVLMAIDELVANDPKIKQLESKIAELEAKIAAGKITKRKEAVKKAIDKLDSLINDNLTFSDATGAVAIAKQGLIVAREAIKAGDKVVDAIEKAVRFVNAKTGNKKWDEKAFRDAIENSLSDIREDLDTLYDEKKALQESKKKLKDSIRTGLQSGDFSDLKSHLTEKGMSEEDIDTYISNLKEKHEKAVIYAVSKRIDKNLGLTPKKPIEKSLAYIEANSEPLTEDEIEARLKNEIDKVSAKVENLVAKRIEKNTATEAEIAEKKKLAELKRLENQKSHDKADKLAMDIFRNEPLTEEEINARLDKKKKELDDKIESERAKRIKKNLETTKEKQLRTERENLERDIREKTTSQIAKKIANSEPLTEEEKMSLLKKKNNLEDLTDLEQRRLKELYDEVERVYTDPDLKMEAINNLRYEAQKLIPKTRLGSFLSYYNSNIYYPNILSGGWTSALNLKDAFFNTIDLVPQMRKGGMEAYKDQFKGLKEGLQKAKIGLSEGFINQGLLNNAEFDKLDLSKKTSEDFAKEGSKIAKYYSRWVGRVMALPNTIGEATKFSVLSFIIQKDLESQGFKGRALVDRKNELLYGTFGKREELTPKARKLVYGTEVPTKKDAISEAKVQRTVTNMILADMQNQMTTKEGQEAVEVATQIKDKVTYQQTATGILGFLPYAERKLGTMGKSGKAIQEFTRKFLGVEFLNTSMNVANTALDYTPYGYARANDKSVSRGLDAAIKYLTKEDFIIDEIGYSEGKSSEEKARIKEKANKGMALLGGILLTTIAQSLSDDDDEENRIVTGSLKPIDYLNQKTKYQHEKEANLAIPAYSIKLPGIGWWNYAGTPLVGVLSIAGNVSDYLYAKKSQDLTWEEYVKSIPYGAVNTLKAIMIDGTPIGSQLERNKISKNTDAENTESQLGQWMAHKTANMAGGLVPNLLKSLAKDFDSTNYTPDKMAMMVAKSTGVLNMYSAFGGNPNVPYAVDLLGNKISTKSGEKYFNIQKDDVSEEDKKLYKLLLDVYKEPSNYPSYLNPKTPIFANETKEKEYQDKLATIDKLYKKGSITEQGMLNRIDALEKESAKIDDIGNDKMLYTKALETCGELFKRGLKDNYDAIKNIPNDADRRKEVDEILKEAKRLTKAEFSVQTDEE